MNQSTSLQEIADCLNRLSNWEDRYRYLVELGQALPRLAKDEKIPANKIDGCMSQVWLVPGIERRDGHLILSFRGESDAMIVQGLVAVLLALYSGRTAPEIVATDALEFFDRMGLREHLTTQRANGLMAMVKRIRDEGYAHLPDA